MPRISSRRNLHVLMFDHCNDETEELCSNLFHRQWYKHRVDWLVNKRHRRWHIPHIWESLRTGTNPNKCNNRRSLPQLDGTQFEPDVSFAWHLIAILFVVSIYMIYWVPLVLIKKLKVWTFFHYLLLFIHYP